MGFAVWTITIDMAGDAVRDWLLAHYTPGRGMPAGLLYEELDQARFQLRPEPEAVGKGPDVILSLVPQLFAEQVDDGQELLRDLEAPFQVLMEPRS